MAFVLETEATKRPNSGAQSIWLKFTGEGYTVQVTASFEMAISSSFRLAHHCMKGNLP